MEERVGARGPGGCLQGLFGGGGVTYERQRKFITLNSCQSRFSGVYLVFKVFQDILYSNKENPVNGLQLCKFVLILISFRSRSGF